MVSHIAGSRKTALRQRQREGCLFYNRKFRHSVEEPKVLPNIMPKAFCSVIGFRWQKVRYKIFIGRLHKIFPCADLGKWIFQIFCQRYDMRTQPPDTRHPGSNRAFRDFHVPKLPGLEQNIKKISYSCARQRQEYFVQSAFTVYLAHLLPPEP